MRRRVLSLDEASARPRPDRFGYPASWALSALRGLVAWERDPYWRSRGALVHAGLLIADGRPQDALQALERVPDVDADFDSWLLRHRCHTALEDPGAAEECLARCRCLDAERTRLASTPIGHAVFVFSLPAYVGSMRLHAQTAALLLGLGYRVSSIVVRSDSLDVPDLPPAMVLADPAELVPALRAVADGDRVLVCAGTWHDYAACVAARVGPVVGFNAGDPALNEPDKLDAAFNQFLARVHRLPVTLVAQSRYVQAAVENRFGRRAAYVPAEVRDQFFTISPRTSDTFRFLLVGSPRLPHKGIQHVLLAASRLQAAGTTVDCSWISPDPLDANGLPPGCTPYVDPPRDGIPVIYSGCDVLVYPSTVEGLGLPPLEAMAAGVAVITTENRGSAEYVEDGENCLLVPADDPLAIQRALERLIRSDELRRRLVEGGRRTAARYSRAAVGERLLRVLDEVTPDLGV